MLQSGTNTTSISTGLRGRATARARSGALDVPHSAEYIRKELRRLGRMARLMQNGELAHFIDVATEVATEAAVGKAGR